MVTLMKSRICLAFCLSIGLYTLASLSVSGADEPSGPAQKAPADLSYTPLPILNDDGTSTPSEPIRVTEIPEKIREEFNIKPFYKKCAIIRGIPVIGSENVSDFAFLECAWTLDHLLHARKLPYDALIKAKSKIGIIAVTEYTMDIPENQNPRMMAKGAYNDGRSRGLGGLKLTTCAEENLLNLKGDKYTRENITIHEHAHTIASAIRQVQPEWYERLKEAQKAAKERGDYGNSYAISNEQEYWAEGAQCWFDCANARNAGGASNRAELKAKDPALAELLSEVYGDGDWRYVKTMNRPAEDTKHLAGMDRSLFPAFDLSKSPRVRAEKLAAEEAKKKEAEEKLAKDKAEAEAKATEPATPAPPPADGK
jgi:hypothetical protein